MARMGADGVSRLSRLKLGTAVFTPDGRRWKPVHALPEARRADRVELAVERGIGRRLIAERVPPEVAEARRRRRRDGASRRRRRVTAEALAMCGWTALVTDAPAAKLTAAEALVLRRARWQIELLFGLWKSHGGLDAWRTSAPRRVLCEVYAKLVAMVAQHWLVLLGCWSRPDRSPVKAAATVRRHAPALAAARGRIGRLCAAIGALAAGLRSGCRMNPRRGSPNTYQLLLNLTTGGLKGRVVPLDFRARRWCRPLAVPRFGERFGFLGGPVVHGGRSYFSLSTYDGTETGCDGKPYHFCNSILEFDPSARRFEFLTLEAEGCYYQIAYMLSAGGEFFATGSNIRGPDGTLDRDRAGEVVFWQTVPVGGR